MQKIRRTLLGTEQRRNACGGRAECDKNDENRRGNGFHDESERWAVYNSGSELVWKRLSWQSLFIPVWLTNITFEMEEIALRGSDIRNKPIGRIDWELQLCTLRLLLIDWCI